MIHSFAAQIVREQDVMRQRVHPENKGTMRRLMVPQDTFFKPEIPV
jgi:hypothetical protein